MKLSDRQAHDLLQIAIDSTRFSGNAFTFAHEDRLRLVNQILDQQDSTLRELSTKDLTSGNDLG